MILQKHHQNEDAFETERECQETRPKPDPHKPAILLDHHASNMDLPPAIDRDSQVMVSGIQPESLLGLFLFCLFEARSHYWPQIHEIITDDFNLLILLPLTPECWDC